MGKPIITLDTWSGWISPNKQKGYQDMKWVDIYREDWVVQLNRRLNELASWADITDDVITQYIEFDWEVVVQEQWVDIMKWTSDWSTWTAAHTNGQTWDWFDLAVFQWNLFYTSTAKLWRATDLSTYNDSLASFTNWTQDIHPMKIFQNKLYVWDWNTLLEVDSDAGSTTSASAFILPSDEIIYSLEVLWNEIALWTNNWNFYLWDWSSANSSVIIKTDKWAIRWLVEIDNTMFIFAWNLWTIYVYNWSDLVPFLSIPDFVDSNNSDYFQSTCAKHTSIKLFKNWIIFWITQNWLYVLNRNSKNQPFALTKYWDTDNTASSTTPVIPYLIDADKNVDDLIVWYGKKMDKVTIWSWDYFYKQGEAYIQTPHFDITTEFWFSELIQWILTLFWATLEQSGLYNDPVNTLRIKYRFDRAETFSPTAEDWTTLTTEITDSNVDSVIREIMWRWREIQFRLEIWTSSWENTKLVQIKIF